MYFLPSEVQTLSFLQKPSVATISTALAGSSAIVAIPAFKKQLFTTLALLAALISSQPLTQQSDKTQVLIVAAEHSLTLMSTLMQSLPTLVPAPNPISLTSSIAHFSVAVNNSTATPPATTKEEGCTLSHLNLVVSGAVADVVAPDKF